MRKMLVGLTALSLSACTFSRAMAGPVVGWRTDGLSVYPDAQPPTEWSADKDIVWKTPMPGWSNSTPLVLSDRILTCSEPTNLICLNKADGKILWTKSNAYADVMTPEELDQAAKDKAEANRIRKEEIGPLDKERNEAQKALNALLPLKPKANATQPATAPTPEQVAAIEAAKKQLGAADAKLRAAKNKLGPLSKWDLPAFHPSNGQSSTTPVSDGKVIGVVFNNGVATVYDLDGNRKWARMIEKPSNGYGISASPLIFGDKLIFQFQNLKAFDLATGKEIWTAANTECHYGSPAISRVGDVDVVITSAGDVVDLATGKVLLKRLCPMDFNSAIVSDAIAYFIQANGRAVKISAGADGKLDAKTLWSTKPKGGDRYYSSPLLYDNLIYAINENRHISVIDAVTGAVAAEKTLDLGKSTVYSSIALAGKYLFVSNEDGQTVVLEPGKDFKEVAHNTLEHFRCTPIFEGKRMYIRGYKTMYCIGE